MKQSLDLIISWPIGFDYPLWRKFVRKERSRFKRVIVVWTNNHNGLDLHAQIEEKMKKDDISFMQAPQHSGDQDWRNVAVNHALGYSQSDWVWFTEQDFLPKEGFWEEVEERMLEVDIVSAYDQLRMHPCCIFIKRSVLEKTSKDFSADPDAKWDHFGQLQLELMNWEPPLVAYKISDSHYYHMAGLTHNMWLHQNGHLIGYHPEEFRSYLKKCKKVK
jgi:hypothetical protein